MHFAARILLLRMIDVRMEVSLQGPIAARRVRIQATARMDGEVGCLLYRSDGKISHALHHNSPLAADPRDDGGPVFVIVAPAGLAFLPPATWPAPQVFFYRRVSLALSGQLCDRVHPIRRCPLLGDPFHRTGRHCTATSTSGSWCGYGSLIPSQYDKMNTTGITERWRESSAGASVCSGLRVCG
jgi:hypothetical protein